MPEGTKVDELYMELTLAMDSLDSDFALADEKIKSYTAKMRREQNINKIKMDIELNGFDDALKNEEALAAKMKHLNSIINDQKKIIEATKIAYDQSVKAKGADYYQSKRLEDSILKQQKLHMNKVLKLKDLTALMLGKLKKTYYVKKKVY